MMVISYPCRVATKLMRLFTKDFVEIERDAERLITPEVIPQRVNRYYNLRIDLHLSSTFVFQWI